MLIHACLYIYNQNNDNTLLWKSSKIGTCVNLKVFNVVLGFPKKICPIWLLIYKKSIQYNYKSLKSAKWDACSMSGNMEMVDVLCSLDLRISKSPAGTRLLKTWLHGGYHSVTCTIFIILRPEAGEIAQRLGALTALLKAVEFSPPTLNHP